MSCFDVLLKYSMRRNKKENVWRDDGIVAWNKTNWRNNNG